MYIFYVDFSYTIQNLYYGNSTKFYASDLSLGALNFFPKPIILNRPNGSQNFRSKKDLDDSNE